MIEIKHLSKSFENNGLTVDALHDVNITIEDGDIYGIIGMSGAGKSTLVRCINMLERPTDGQIIVNGKDMGMLNPAELRAARREITMIFQAFNLLKQRNCLKNVCFPLELVGTPKAEAENILNHTVQEGDTLDKIALMYGANTPADVSQKVNDIKAKNPTIQSDKDLKVGTIIRVPFTPVVPN